MATWLSLTNAVLMRLRETQATTVSGGDAYTQLIGAFVNETKREVEDAWDWFALRQRVTVTTVSGTQEYTLTGTNKRTRIAEVRNATDKLDMNQVSLAQIEFDTEIATTQTGQPTQWAISGQDDTTGELKIKLNATPNGVKTLYFHCYTPQDDLADDSTTVLKVPSQPVIDGAYARAISERGEDGGRMSDAQFGIYRSTLGDFIAQDVGRNGGIIWEPV